jgi:hypothetical protein
VNGGFSSFIVLLFLSYAFPSATWEEGEIELGFAV